MLLIPGGKLSKDLKEEFESEDYVLCGYWGGLRPNVLGFPESVVVRPKLSLGLEMTMEDLAVDKIVEARIGLAPPKLVDQMCEGLHSHLEAVGIKGVKVDVTYSGVPKQPD
jgi:raffinose synthase